MSKRRPPGEIVLRKPGSGFCGSAEPRLVRVPVEPACTDEADCCLVCSHPDCREWANLQVVGGKHDGQWLCHISECQMGDAP